MNTRFGLQLCSIHRSNTTNLISDPRHYYIPPREQRAARLIQLILPAPAGASDASKGSNTTPFISSFRYLLKNSLKAGNVASFIFFKHVLAPIAREYVLCFHLKVYYMFKKCLIF